MVSLQAPHALLPRSLPPINVPGYHSLASMSPLQSYASCRRPGPSLGIVTLRASFSLWIQTNASTAAIADVGVCSVILAVFSSLQTRALAAIKITIMLDDLRNGLSSLGQKLVSQQLLSLHLSIPGIRGRSRGLVFPGIAATSFACPSAFRAITLALRKRFMRVSSRGVEHAGNGGPLWDFCMRWKHPPVAAYLTMHGPYEGAASMCRFLSQYSISQKVFMNQVD